MRLGHAPDHRHHRAALLRQIPQGLGPSREQARGPHVLAQPRDVLAQPRDVLAQPRDVLAQPRDVLAQGADLLEQGIKSLFQGHGRVLALHSQEL